MSEGHPKLVSANRERRAVRTMEREGALGDIGASILLCLGRTVTTGILAIVVVC